MLARFATGASFSTDSKGGGKESNSYFLPFMVQMASHLVDGSANQQQRHAMAKAVTTYLSSSPSTPESPVWLSASVSRSRAGSGSSEETVQFMMVYSLLSESYESWLQHRPAFLQKGICHAYMQHKHGRSTLKLFPDSSSAVGSDEGSSTDIDENKKLFTIVQPMLVYTGLIQQLQQFFKKGKSSSMSRSGEYTESGGNLEKWEIQMKEKLYNMKEMVGLSKDILAWLEDMMSSEDLQEAFDVMGALTDVFSGGHTKCEDFVRAAIHAGRS
jgi:E3 ubiquitin-protein ligase UBR4